MDSVALSLISPSSSSAFLAICPDSFITSAVSFMDFTWLVESSIIVPMEIMDSVAPCVSCAWLVALVAISFTAVSTLFTFSAVFAALLFNVSDASNNCPLCCRIFCTISVRASFIRSTAFAMLPTSPRCAAHCSSTWSFRRSSCAIRFTESVIFDNGRVIRVAKTNAAKAPSNSSTPEIRIPLCSSINAGARRSASSAVTTRINCFLLV